MIRSLVRPVNLFASGYSYLKSSVTRNPDINCMPLSISTELTNNCNLNCPQCVSGSGKMTRTRGFMETGLFDKIMRELSPYIYTVNLYFQGEPMLHPQFFTFVRNCNAPRKVVSTNGHFLSIKNSEEIIKSGLDRLIVSLDGTNQETYSAYRKNGNLENVIEGLNNVTRAKKKYSSSLKIELQFLVNKFNEHQIPQIRELAAKVQATLRLKSMQIINNSDFGSWLPSKSPFRRYKVKDGNYILKNSLPDRCARLWFNPVVTWDGKVVPCCFDKNAEYVMGDLKTDSFREIWEGTKYRIFRKSILTGRNMIDMCRNCTSGLRGVKY
jgi:radical SAM protein with 4Fe4S-binding SPASM domain